MRKCPQCGHTRARFSHRNLFEKLVGWVLQWRPYRCNACMRRFWWFAWKRRELERHRNTLVLVGVALAVLIGGFVYMKTLPYETELPREPGVRPAPSAEVAAETTEENSATALPASLSETDPSALTDEDLESLTRPPGLRSPVQASRIEETAEVEPEEPIQLTLPTAPPFEASALRDSGRLLDILSVEDPEQLHVLLKTDAPPRTFEYFMLSGPQRLVIDIQGRWTTDLPSALPLDHRLTEGMRIGRHEDMVRVVVQLKESIGLPEIKVRSDGLALTLRSPG